MPNLNKDIIPSTNHVIANTDSENIAPNFLKNGSGSIISKSKPFASISKMMNKASSESVRRYAQIPVEDDNISFPDVECGEVIRLQRLVVDFTPEDEDDLRLDKCYAFWDFVNKNHELDEFLQTPIPIENVSTATGTERTDSDSTLATKK